MMAAGTSVATSGSKPSGAAYPISFASTSWCARCVAVSPSDPASASAMPAATASCPMLE